jgi:hypothetical protein
VAEQLGRALGRGVRRDRPIGRVLLLERRLAARAVDRRGAAVDEPLAAARRHAVEQVERAGHVHVDVELRLADRRPHARLRREVHHLVGLRACERVEHGGAIAQVALDQRERLARERAAQVPPLDRRVVEGVEVVEPDDGVAAREQPVAQMRSDEARGAGDEDPAHVDRGARTTPRLSTA